MAPRRGAGSVQHDANDGRNRSSLHRKAGVKSSSRRAAAVRPRRAPAESLSRVSQAGRREQSRVRPASPSETGSVHRDHPRGARVAGDERRGAGRVAGRAARPARRPRAGAHSRRAGRPVHGRLAGRDRTPVARRVRRALHRARRRRPDGVRHPPPDAGRDRVDAQPPPDPVRGRADGRLRLGHRFSRAYKRTVGVSPSAAARTA